MHIIYVSEVVGNSASVTGEDFRHLTVLRIAVGERLFVSDGKFTYRGTVESVSKKEAVLSLKDKTPITEKAASVTLFHALCKKDKNEFVIQKAAELGADRVVLFSSENCVCKPNEKTLAKLERFNKIAREASMQCGRETPLTVDGVINFATAVDLLAEADLPLFFYEGGGMRFSDYLSKKPLQGNIVAIIGSEGGFSPSEAKQITDAGIPSLSLGSRILRTETAPLLVLSVLAEHMGEF